MNTLNTVLVIVLIILLILLLFLVLRQLNCWYWRINERVKLQEQQNELLTQMLDQLKKKNAESKDLKSNSNPQNGTTNKEQPNNK